jgi:hypothetical protein
MPKFVIERERPLAAKLSAADLQRERLRANLIRLLLYRVAQTERSL